MRVLGLWDGHDAGLALVDDGRLVFALSEERPSRVKRARGFPYRAFAELFEWLGTGYGAIDAVAVAGGSGRLPLRLLDGVYRGRSPGEDPTGTLSRVLRAYENRVSALGPLARLETRLSLATLNSRLQAVGIPGALSMEVVPHHLAHAYSALGTSGLTTPLVLTLDAYGEGCAGARLDGKDERFEEVVPVRHSLAMLYGAITGFLGFREGDEGKVMGLAARGDPEVLGPYFRALVEPGNGRITLGEGMPFRRLRRRIDQASPEDVAAALQARVEEAMERFLRAQLESSWSGPPRDVALAGGLFANCQINGKLLDVEGVRELFVFPHMGDGGLAAGAALRAWHRATDRRGAFSEMAHPFLGMEYGEARMVGALQRAGLHWTRPKVLADAVGRLLASGKSVARFTGREEFGPRALGNRSILFSADDVDLSERVNRRLRRDWFMPFAPATLEERADEMVFNASRIRRAARFMTIAARCTETMAVLSPAAVHRDGTARVQLVSREHHPDFHAILTAYEKRTAIPTVINTSFNRHSEPIVHTPEEAVATFLAARLDALALGPYLVYRDGRDAPGK